MQGENSRSYSGRVHGNTLRLLGAGGTAWQATVDRDTLRGGHTTNPATATLPWRRAQGGSCR